MRMSQFLCTQGNAVHHCTAVLNCPCLSPSAKSLSPCSLWNGPLFSPQKLWMWTCLENESSQMQWRDSAWDHPRLPRWPFNLTASFLMWRRRDSQGCGLGMGAEIGAMSLWAPLTQCNFWTRIVSFSSAANILQYMCSLHAWTSSTKEFICQNFLILCLQEWVMFSQCKARVLLV